MHPGSFSRFHCEKSVSASSDEHELAKAARALDNCVIDSKICAVGKDGVTDFSALQAAMTSNKTHARRESTRIPAGLQSRFLKNGFDGPIPVAA